MKVVFKRKLVNQTFFTLQVTTHTSGEISQSINKQYKDFEALQSIVSQVAAKQNLAFQNDALSGDSQPIVVHAPLLSKVKGPAFSQIDETTQLIALIDSLERFCNEVVSNKLFWVSDVLVFFSIQIDAPAGRKLTTERE